MEPDSLWWNDVCSLRGFGQNIEPFRKKILYKCNKEGKLKEGEFSVLSILGVCIYYNIYMYIYNSSKEFVSWKERSSNIFSFYLENERKRIGFQMWQGFALKYNWFLQSYFFWGYLFSMPGSVGAPSWIMRLA